MSASVRLITTSFLLGCSFLLASCTENPEVIENEIMPADFVAQAECKPDANLSVHCGYKNAEDLALTPDGKFLIMTGFSALPDIGAATVAIPHEGHRIQILNTILCAALRTPCYFYS